MARNPRKQSGKHQGINRRTLLVGGGVAAGLLIAWGAWPRSYQPNLNAAPGETIVNAFLKIDASGQIIVVVPQTEMGQGVTTVLPQILADELGADWRTVAVQSAPISPLYANTLLAREWLSSDWTRLAGGAGDWAINQYATRGALMLTGGGTSIPMFHDAYRDAGAAARVLLCKAAAARWAIPWESCDIAEGIISDGAARRMKIGDIVADAAKFDLPAILPYRQGQDGRLSGQDLPRLDTPSKIDGSHNFAADIRLPDMVYASIRQGPIGDAMLAGLDERSASGVTGFLKLVGREQGARPRRSVLHAARHACQQRHHRRYTGKGVRKFRRSPPLCAGRPGAGVRRRNHPCQRISGRCGPPFVARTALRHRAHHR
jgi:isoquinoline 1-oxidoreductase beta subunit